MQVVICFPSINTNVQVPSSQSVHLLNRSNNANIVDPLLNVNSGSNVELIRVIAEKGGGIAVPEVTVHTEIGQEIVVDTESGT